MSEEIEKKNEAEWIQGERSPGEIVVMTRKKLGWSQEELQWRSGVPVSQIYKVENDRKKVSISVIERLENALGIPLKGAMDAYWQGKDTTMPRSRTFPEKTIIKDFVREVISRNPSEEQMKKAFGVALHKFDSELKKSEGNPS